MRYDNTEYLDDKIKSLKIERDSLKKEIEQFKHEREIVAKEMNNAVQALIMLKMEKSEQRIKEVDFIILSSAKSFGITVETFKSRSRIRSAVYARNFVAATIKKLHPKTTLTKIGKILDRDHSNIIHCLKSHEADSVYTDEYKHGIEIAQLLIDDYFITKEGLQ